MLLDNSGLPSHMVKYALVPTQKYELIMQEGKYMYDLLKRVLRSDRLPGSNVPVITGILQDDINKYLKESNVCWTNLSM